MFISRIALHNVQELIQSRPFLQNTKNVYSQHQFLWTLFADNSKEEKSQFLFRHEPNFHKLGFIVVSEKEPISHPAWNIQTKVYDPKIKDGDILEFTVTVNPIITKNKKRSDVVMNWRFENDRKSKPIADVVSDEGLRWLTSRSQKNGFEILQAKTNGYMQRQFYKSHSKQPIKISTIDFSGILKVCDEVLFKDLLQNGLGPAKGFGCGLFLVKRSL